jgi:hypothetical protein
MNRSPDATSPLRPDGKRAIPAWIFMWSMGIFLGILTLTGRTEPNSVGEIVSFAILMAWLLLTPIVVRRFTYLWISGDELHVRTPSSHRKVALSNIRGISLGIQAIVTRRDGKRGLRLGAGWSTAQLQQLADHLSVPLISATKRRD